MAAVTQLGGALRELIEVTVSTTVDPGEVRVAADLVRGVTERLAVSRRPASQLPALDDVGSGRRVFNPVSGVGNPLAPPLVLRQDDGGVVGEATLGVAYEGPPSYVHGGMSALLMDQVLGTAAAVAGLWGMTAHRCPWGSAWSCGAGWPRTTGASPSSSAPSRWPRHPTRPSSRHAGCS